MDSAQELLRESNSFYNNNESDPWEMHFPVISSINGETFTTIHGILKNFQENPSQNTGIAIFGEAGFGKNHIIGKIQKDCESTNISAFFSNIRSIIDEKSPMRHLLKGIITSLAHDIEWTQGYSPIHKLISEIICDYFKENFKNSSIKSQKL
jgi:DNA replication protein DnaC